MNKVILSGNLCKENDLKFTGQGKEVLNNTIAVKREYKNANGEYESDFINIVLYGSQALFIATYAPKGSSVELSGRWQHRSYTNAQGTTSYVDEVVVESVSILKSTQPRENEQPQANAQANYQPPAFNMEDEDLPF